MEQPTIVDGRNFLDPKSLASAGFDYIGIGIPTVDLLTISDFLSTKITDRVLRTAA
jgi:hypothetical protein